MSGFEINFDGLVGPTHHYAGLSFGNEASFKHRHLISNPRLAAQQGLEKMKALADLGLKQAVLPPHHRPILPELHRLGFQGSDHHCLEQAYQDAPQILSALYSASSMWTANAATVSPSADTQDQKIHFTPANLCLNYHRHLEQYSTEKIFKRIFQDENYFVHHRALPNVPLFGDEGAANHLRFCQDYDQTGVEVFVYGKSFSQKQQHTPTQYPARQSLEASQAIARLHGLNAKNVCFLQQNPEVIDQGVFHNDVISVNNKNVLFTHEKAFLNQDQVLKQLTEQLQQQSISLNIIQVPEQLVSVQDAVNSYLFNSQIISHPNGTMTLVLPEEARQNQAVWNYLQQHLLAEKTIDNIQFFNLRESMQNGGGPACLRLRVAVNAQEYAAIHPHIFLNDHLFIQLHAWIERHYRDRLSIHDLIDPQLMSETQTALDELTQILALGAIYSFQT